MNARELEEAQDDLRHRRRHALETTALAILAGLAAGGVSPLAPRIALALALVAAVEAAVVAMTIMLRREQIAKLALDPTAYCLPEVEHYGRRCTAQRQRDSLAAWIREMLAEAHLPHSIYLTDRVGQFAHDLDTLARELASSAVRVQPVSVVACQRLLTHAVESPLYNPRVPPDELAVTLRSIRRGITIR